MSKRLTARLEQLAVLTAALIVVFPLVYGVLGAFKRPDEFVSSAPRLLPESFGNLQNFITVFDRLPMLRFFWNSLFTAMLASTVRLVLSLLAAYAFAFFRFRGKRLLFMLLLGTMMLPADTLLITNYRTVSSMGLLDSYLGICIVGFLGASQMFMLRQNFLSAPLGLHEAAVLDGCGDTRFLFSILLPISVPILVTLFLQSFILQWNAYLWPLLVTNRTDMRTLQVGVTMITSLEGSNYEEVLAAVTLTMIPSLLLFLLLRRKIATAMTAGSMVG